MSAAASDRWLPHSGTWPGRSAARFVPAALDTADNKVMRNVQKMAVAAARKAKSSPALLEEAELLFEMFAPLTFGIFVYLVMLI